MAKTYYSPFFPNPYESEGSKGTTVPVITPGTITDIIEGIDDLQDQINNIGPGPDPVPPVKIEGLELSTHMEYNVDGTQIIFVIAEWDPAPEDDIGMYIAAIKEGSGGYVEFPVGSTAPAYKWSVRGGQTFTVKVLAQDTGGNKGAWSDEETIVSAADTIPPGVATDLVATPSFRNIYLSWTNPSDSDLAKVFIYENSVNNSGTATRIATVNAAPSAAGGFTRSGMGSGVERFFWVKTVDTSGNASGFSAVASGTTASTDISTLELGPNVVTYEKLGIGSLDNLVPNADFTSGTGGWAPVLPGESAVTAVPYKGPEGLGILITKTASFDGHVALRMPGFESGLLDKAVLVEPNSKIRIKLKVTRKSGSSVNTHAGMALFLVLDNSTVVSVVPNTLVHNPSSTTTSINVEYTIPSNVRGIYFSLDYVVDAGNPGGSVAITDISVRRMNAGELIVDGTITGSKIVGETITGDKLTAGTITGDKISSTTSLPASLTIGTTGFQLGTVRSAILRSDSFENLNAKFLSWSSSNIPEAFNIGYGASTNFYKGFDSQGNVGWGIKGPAGGISYGTQYNTSLRGSVLLKEGEWVVIEATIYLKSGTLNGAGVIVRPHYRNIHDALTFSTDPDITGTVVGAGTPGNTYTFRKLCQLSYAITDWGNDVMELCSHHTPFGDISVANDIIWLTAGFRRATREEYDPARRINAYTTQIDPGKIYISGGTTLANWRNGGDQTKIEGGSIATNTISANKLTIGSQNLHIPEMQFTGNWNGWGYQANRVYWNGGWIGYNGGLNWFYVNPGSADWTGDALYIYWPKDSSYLVATADPYTSSSGNNVCLATYNGGVSLVVNYGRTIIDGSNITTGTITANKMNVSQLSAISATIGTLRTATSGGRMEISDNVLKVFDASNVLRVKLGNLDL